jgi:Reverse transcriptase (RNA-dependent DNA polymerase)
VINERALSKPSDIAQCFSDKFAKFFWQSTIIVCYCMNDVNVSIIHEPVLDSCNVTLDEVRHLLYHQGASSAGPDGIPGVFYKKLASVLALPLLIVFQQSLHQGVIPDMWRQAKIIPLYKGKDSRLAPSSYRPISLTDVACKLLERIVAKQIQSFWLENKIICSEQHGFRPKRSTESNLVLCDSFIASILNKGLACDVILLDFKRAFDKVPHVKLINKLRSLKIGDRVLQWISNFLEGRTQTVHYNEATSEPVKVVSGLVQGSVLGPLFFTGFINDLPHSVLHSRLYMFADDGKLVGLANNALEHNLVQADLTAVAMWSDENDLPLCIEKCVTLHYGARNPALQYNINSVAIRVADACADLGVTRTSNFRYSEHINLLCLRASRLCGMVRKLFATRSSEFLVKLFTSYIRPVLEYASIVWNPCEVGLSNRLESVQRRFTRQLFPYPAPEYDDRLRVINLPQLQTRRLAADLIYAYKCLHGYVDIQPDQIGLSFVTSVTRGNGINLAVQRASTCYVARSFNYRIAEQWNRLPLNVKIAPSLSSFKNRLWSHLML